MYGVVAAERGPDVPRMASSAALNKPTDADPTTIRRRYSTALTGWEHQSYVM